VLHSMGLLCGGRQRRGAEARSHEQDQQITPPHWMASLTVASTHGGILRRSVSAWYAGEKQPCHVYGLSFGQSS